MRFDYRFGVFCLLTLAAGTGFADDPVTIPVLPAQPVQSNPSFNPDSYYSFLLDKTDLFLTVVTSDGKKKDPKLQVQRFQNLDGQLWKIIVTKDGTWFESRLGGIYMQIPGANIESGSPVRAGSQLPAQRWVLTTNGNQGYGIVVYGKKLAVSVKDFAYGAELVLREWTRDRSQVWLLKEELKPGETFPNRGDDPANPDDARNPVDGEPRRNLDIAGKKVAIVEVQTILKDLTPEDLEAIYFFLTNAFVNYGSVKVVDRNNIAKIIRESEFQQAGLVDETTAVKIGKIAGADYIVIGNLTGIGGTYYLNLNLISTETAEIVASAIAEAKEAAEFKDACFMAVKSMF